MPVSSTQNAIGPLARHVVDTAAMLQSMAAADPADPQTTDNPHQDYLARWMLTRSSLVRSFI